MGNPKKFMPGGKFSQYLYMPNEDYPVIVTGSIKAKVVKNVADPSGRHTSLPLGAGTFDMYFRLGADGHIAQARVYVNRLACIDFDWGHNHYNNPDKGGNGQWFRKGVVHVQNISFNADGSVSRLSANARYMSDEEIAKYGNIILKFAPDVSFR